LTSDKAIITKLDQNIKQIEIYTSYKIWGRKGYGLDWDPSISPEPLGLQTSNLVSSWRTRSITQKLQKQIIRECATWPICKISGPPQYI